MSPSHRELDRRRFHELSAAALGGLLAGAAAGCGSSNDKGAGAGSGTGSSGAGSGIAASSGEKHTCRGLNECKGQGAGSKNDCRGMGDCATFASHSCGGQNACKGQGGCGENPALNECKGQGSCAIPLMPAAWKAVRERAESAWKEKGSEFGEAPDKK
ncbi:MAG: hypothetical protein FJ295_08605 [Planctomycetes bacterium]|nr:hypothetical protein [Planctomycetota bacterium]